MSGWDFPGEDEFREDERARRRWWAENYPPDRGQPPPRCQFGWVGECPGKRKCHECARPRGHGLLPRSESVSGCMCYCGEIHPGHRARTSPVPVPAGIQETLL